MVCLARRYADLRAAAAIDQADGLNYFDAGVDQHPDRFQQRLSGRDGVLDHCDHISDGERTDETAAGAMVFGFLADRKSSQPAAPCRTHHRHRQGHRIGTHGHPSDRRHPPVENLQDRLAYQPGTFPGVGGLAGVEIPVRCRSRPQNERPIGPQGVVLEMFDQGFHTGRHIRIGRLNHGRQVPIIARSSRGFPSPFVVFADSSGRP